MPLRLLVEHFAERNVLADDVIPAAFIDDFCFCFNVNVRAFEKFPGQGYFVGLLLPVKMT